MQHGICDNCGEQFTHEPQYGQVDEKGVFFCFCSIDCQRCFQEVFAWENDEYLILREEVK
jgi:hypothetical protein